jgi:hypothetical protein
VRVSRKGTPAHFRPIIAHRLHESATKIPVTLDEVGHPGRQAEHVFQH